MIYRIGTRSSAMALVQADWVKTAVEKAGHKAEICPMKTDGDLDLKSPLHTIGGKGVFIKRIEKALLDGEVDIAVHSLKDMTTESPEGLETVAYLPTNTARDALVGKSLQELQSGDRVGTGSLRRKALLKELRPDLEAVEIRGNVIRRLERLDAGDFDALILSEAGLERLGLKERVSESLSEELFCPAPGQGVVACQMRKGEGLAGLGCPLQSKKTQVEWRFLEKVGLDCRSPLGAFVTVFESEMTFQVFVATDDFAKSWHQTFRFPKSEGLLWAEKIADKTLEWLKACGCSS